jgi:hypothetical protein
VTILLIIVAVIALAFLALKFVRGMTKFAILAVVVLIALFVAHLQGAF